MHLPHVKSFANAMEQVREAALKLFLKHEQESEAHQVILKKNFLPDDYNFSHLQIFRRASVSHRPKGSIPSADSPDTVNPVR